MVSSTLVRKWVKQIQSFGRSNGTFTALQPSQGLSLRPTIQPTLSWASIKTFRQDTKEILEQTSCDSHLLYHAECSLSCCWPFQLMPSIFVWRWPGSGKAQNWTLFKSIFESLHGLLFVVTRSSCAPSTLFGLCFSVFGGSAKDNCLRCHHQNLLQLQTAFVQMNL